MKINRWETKNKGFRRQKKRLNIVNKSSNKMIKIKKIPVLIGFKKRNLFVINYQRKSIVL